MFKTSASRAFRAVRELPTRAYVGAAALVPFMASAQSADPFDAALATATTKVTSYAGAMVGLAAVSVVFLIAIKYVKKIPKAS